MCQRHGSLSMLVVLKNLVSFDSTFSVQLVTLDSDVVRQIVES